MPNSNETPAKPGPGKSRAREQRPQEYYDAIKARFAEERDLRLTYRPEGVDQFTTEVEGRLKVYQSDPYAGEPEPRPSIDDTVEVLFIGGGFSALLTSARLREAGVESIRIVERGSDVGGTWYWNRYPGVACDVVSYDYLPLLDETGYIPSRHYAGGQEIWDYCRMIATKYNLYELAVFQTTVTSTTWNEADQLWHVGTDRGDTMKARFVVCANGIATMPKLARIDGMESFTGHSFHTSRWDFCYTGADLENLHDKVVGIIGTGATAVQAVPNLANTVKDLYVFQRTPSSIDIRDDWETDPEWAKTLTPGWQAKRRERALKAGGLANLRVEVEEVSPEEKLRRQENANIDYMMRIHKRIDEIVEDPATADALKPWYMFMCKRPCFHNEYLASFNQPNVHLIDTHGKGITEITADGPVFDGETFKLDLLIYATGFEIQKTGTWNQILGQDGVDLQDKYAEGIRTLFGIHTHGFPNMFIMGGYQAPFNFNVTDMLQIQGDHIANCVAQVRDNGYATIDCSEEAEEYWVQEVIKHRGKTNRNAECTPGYYNFEGGFNRRQDGNYNGGMLQYLEFLQTAATEFDQKFTFEV